MTVYAEASPQQTSSPITRKAMSRKAMYGLGLGNTLEWYDWQIFGLLAAFIGPQFFAPGDPVSATLSALAVFAVGFAVRPLGGVVLGMVADRIGRRTVMLLSISMMAISTLVIAVLPTYEQIGVWAGIILLITRLVQGISTGIEAPLSTAYAVELSPKGREGRAAGFMSFFVNIGILLASLTSFFTSLFLGTDAMMQWGWRLPFFFGAALGVIVIYMRRALPESLHEEEKAGAPDTEEPGVWRGVRKHWVGLLAILFVVGAAQAYNYAWNVGLPNLARSAYHEGSTTVFAITSILGAILVVGSLITGRMADKWKVSRVFVIARLLAIPSVFLMLMYTGPGIGGFAAVILGGSVVLVLNMTMYNLVSTSLMPKYCRATGVALGYGVAVALFGGTASYLLVWMQQQGISWMFPVYVAVLSAISVVLYLVARRTSGTFAAE